MNRDDYIETIEIEDYEIEIIEIEDEAPLSNLKKYNKTTTLIEKIRKNLTNKKAAIVTFAAVTLLVTLTSVFVIGRTLNKSTWKNETNMVYTSNAENIRFEINNPEYNTIQVNDKYNEYGAKITVDGIDKTEDIIIDTSNINPTKVGTYHVVYTYPIDINNKKSIYRTINVVDNEPPKIKLLGSNIHTLLLNEEYTESGYVVTDNSNENLQEKVKIENNINTKRIGTYYVKYTVEDSSGNQTVKYRTVEVKNSYTINTNSITYNSFTDNGIYIKGTIQSNKFQNKILLKNKTTGNEFEVETKSIGKYYYQLSLDVTNLENGTYEFYLINDSLELITNNMSNYKKLIRTHAGNKLITMNYEKSKVNMKVEPFKYQYDVVIDPGHGGDDTGATNGKYVEKNINLEQSLYEKQRYEQHGLKVLLLRDSNDNYGTVMGYDDWEPLDRKAFAVGYYGAVSRIVYSNHHNSSGNDTSMGWEILAQASKTYEELKTEHEIADTWSRMYAKQINPYYRFYTKDLETATPSNKLNGETYDFEDYYAVLRIPNELFNVKNVIFEGAYVNNKSDMNWYYDKQNWKQLSEVKIKAYVESLGIEYINP